MTQHPGGHELSNQDPLAQNNLLRQTINAMPKRRIFITGESESETADYLATVNRISKQPDDEYRVVLREQFAARLAESYATPSLQKYALMLFEDVYDVGLTHDAMLPIEEQETWRTYLAEGALLTLTAINHLDSPGLYDLYTADEVEAELYSFAQTHLSSTEASIQEIRNGIPEAEHERNATFLPDEGRQLLDMLARRQQLQEISANWPPEYRMQYGKDIYFIDFTGPA